MKKTAMLLIATLSLFLASTAYAMVEVTVLDETFVRGTGSPVWETVTFPGAGGTATIRVINGGLEDSSVEKVSSSEIAVNGQLIFGPNEFSQNVDYLEKEITLSGGQNTLDVLLKSKPGGQVIIQIAKLVEADAAAFVSPAGGTVTLDSEVSIEIPPGGLGGNTLITIRRTGEEGPLSHVYEFGPSGFVFEQPVTITISYNLMSLPVDILEEDLFVASVDNYLEILKNIQVDTIDHKVSGKTTHFSDFALGEYEFTGVNINAFDDNNVVATSFRMPIGDDGIADNGGNISLLKIENYPNGYPKITFNVNDINNDWYVATAFNTDQSLRNFSTGELEPYLASGAFHPGEDWNMLGDDFGKPIHAIADGIVLFSQSQQKREYINEEWESYSFGNIIIIGHKLENGSIIASVYAHMAAISDYSATDSVDEGDRIGFIGGSGGVDPHLHFEITKGNNGLLKIDEDGNIKIPFFESDLKQVGWYWPGSGSEATEFIEANYEDPSVFIKNYAATTPQPSPVTLAENLSNPNYLTIDQNNVYWTETKYVDNYRTVIVERTPISGGNVSVIASQRIGGGGTGGAGIAVDDSYAYWGVNPGYGNGGIYKAPIAGGYIITLVASANQPGDVAVDDSYVYWAENNGGTPSFTGIRKIPIQGGTVITLSNAGHEGGMTLDNSHVFFTYSVSSYRGTTYYVAKIDKDGTNIVNLASSAQNYPHKVAVDNNSVYWTEPNLGTIRKVSKYGGEVITLASGLNQPMQIVVDSSYVYWTEYANGESGSGAIKRVPLSGGEVSTLVHGLTRPSDIAVDNSNIYWSELGDYVVNGFIKKLRKY